MSKSSLAGGWLEQHQQQPDPVRQFTWKAGIGLFTALVLAGGCSLPTVPDQRSQLSAEEYQALYSHSEESRVGDNVAALVAERGPPDTILEAQPLMAPYERGLGVVSYVYDDRAPGGVSCIDAYVVVEETGVIIEHHCR